MSLVFFASFGFAQTSKGSIGGTITDVTDAVITGATVTAKNLDTGEVRTTTTGSNGQFRIDSVELGSYAITINQKGFKPLTYDKVTVSGSVVTSVNAKLTVGGSDQNIVVEASNAAVQTENGENSAVISTKEVAEIPFNSLNPYELATTLPGVSIVTTGSNFTNGVTYSSDGSRPRSNNFMIEGQDNNDAGIHGQGLQPENLGSIQEVSVLLNSTSAEYGHGGGAVANVIYKGGTNKFHGALWDRLSNSSLDATDHNNVYLGNPKSKYRENIFGFNLGGPVVKDKLFFFTSYQWDNYNSSANGDPLILPSTAGYAVLQPYAATNPRVAAMLAAYGTMRGDPTKPGSPVPIQLGIDPTTLANRGTVEVGLVQRLGVPLDTKAPEFDAKGDWNITKNDTLNLRLIRSTYSAPYDFFNNAGQLPGFDSNQSGVSYNAGITWTHVFSPKLLNEARVSYGRIGFWFLLRPDDVPAAHGLEYSVSGLQGWGGSTSFPQGRFHNTYQLQDSVSWTKNKHFIKIGADIADIRVTDTIPYNLNGTISYGRGGNYSALGNFLDDYSGLSAGVAQTFGSNIVHASLPTQSYFAQDSWKVLPNLTVDLGLRYEYNGTPANQMKYPAIDLNNISCYTCVVKQKGDFQDWGPRFSFAYTPQMGHGLLGDGKTVIRGGFGIFYDSVFTNILDNTQSTSPNSVASSLTTGTANTRHVANWSTYFAALPTTPNGNATQDTQSAHLLNPETLQWNMNIQRELPGKYTLEVGYVGTRGEHLFANTFLNPFLGDGVTRLNPARGTIVLRNNSGDSIYHGGHIQLDRKYSNGFQIRGSYTYSKMIDDSAEVFTSGTSNNGAPGNWSGYSVVQYPAPRGTYDRSVSGFDHRHRFTFAYIYDIPKLKNSNAFTQGAGYLVNGWQVSGTTSFQSGTPYNVENGYDSNGDGVSNDRPSVSNPKAPMQTYAFASEQWDGTVGGYCDGPTSMNDPNGNCHPTTPGAVRWVIPASGQGTLGRNALVGPWYSAWAFSLARNIKIHESQSFQIRADMFNPFNQGHKDGDGYWPSYTLLSGITATAPSTSNTFGDFAPAVHGARQIRMMLKYSF